MFNCKAVTKIFIFGLLLLITACGGETEEESMLSGRAMGMYEEKLIVFTEDNVGGDRIVPVARVNFDRDGYEAEAYKVIFTENTRIITEETGKENSYKPEQLAYLYGYPLQVKTSEEFESETGIRNEYIQTTQEDLPEYEAEEVRLLPADIEDFSHFVSTFYLSANGMTDEEEGYLILLTDGDEEVTKEFHMQQEQYDSQLEAYRTEDRHISTANNLGLTWGDYSEPVRMNEVLEHFQLPEEYLQEPTFLIFDVNGFLAAEENWESVLAYFEENTD